MSRGVKATTSASPVDGSCSGCGSVSGARGRLTAEAIALEGLQLFEAGVVGSAGGGLVAMEFAHAVLLVIHVEECEDVARVGVEIVEGFGVRFC
jgi:hypothetical protein